MSENNQEYFLQDLRKEVSKISGYSQKDINNILRTAFDVIGNKLAEGNTIYLVDFCNFTPKDYNAKHVKNPQTGEPMVIEPYRTVLCKPTKALKRKLSKAFD